MCSVVEEDVDILIIGGGVIGFALMHALTSLNERVLLVDDKPIFANQSQFDARSIACSPATIQILTTMGVWPLLADKAVPIEHIHVSEKGALGHARFLGHQRPLGAVVEMADISATFEALVARKQCLAPAQLVAYDLETNQATIKTATGERVIHAKLVVGADGADSFLRKCCGLRVQTKNYHQQALVANIGLARPHRGFAYERFTSDGSIALLPMSHSRTALIWVNSPDKTTTLYQLQEDAFLHTLQRTFGYRLGRFMKVGQRSIYPLFQKIMPEKVVKTVVFIGNAAQTLHPIAGQGFNLGLRDVAMLTQCIATSGLHAETLQYYQTQRQSDEQVMTQFTDGLITLFKSKLPGMAVARSLGLMAMDNSDLLKKMVSHYASGYGGIVSDLICGIPISPHSPAA
jgi:2-octaprenyl-6-methoxyphenol hydroxylase